MVRTQNGGARLPSIRKISPVRKKDLPKAAQKMSIRARSKEQERLFSEEMKVLSRLSRDARMRAEFMCRAGLRWDPLSVWQEIDDRTWHLAETEHYHLRPWRELSEKAKAHLAWFMSQTVGGFSFDVNLAAELERKWAAQGQRVGDRILRRIREQLRALGLADLPYFYAIEGRTTSGRSRTHLHIHGFMATDDALDAPRFKVALEKALCRDDVRKLRRKRGVHMKRLHLNPKAEDPYLHHVSYVLKNIGKYDQRFEGRRLYFSRSMTDLTRLFYRLIVENARGWAGKPI